MAKFVPPNFSKFERDIVVVGDGVAGLTCALTLAEYGLKPLVISRGKGNTFLSQGGISAAVAEDDSPFLHYLDTLKAGKLLNDDEAVRITVYSGDRAILKLISWGVNFDKNGNFYDLTIEAAHSKRRIFKVKDYTGRAIYETLHKKATEYGIEIVKGELCEIYTDEGKVCGIAYKDKDGYKIVELKFLVLATGGAASLYTKNSNIQRVGGDAIGTAVRAGAVLVDTEFVQFHPTVLKGTKYLISEAVRGEGALLINSEGRRFVNELAPRDEVSRAIYSQLKEGKEIFLDFKPLIDRGIKIEERFPQIWDILQKHGYNPYKEVIPVEPAAHYFIGGIESGIYGRTAVKNLYAIGECACTGFHGANRLASNSLLEGVVFGMRAAEDIALRHPFEKLGRVKLKGKSGEDFPLDGEKEVGELQKIMWEKVGIVREGSELKEALEFLNRKLEIYGKYRTKNEEGRKLYDLTLVAKAVVLNALKREESRGCHYRGDFPKEREPFRKIRFEITHKDLSE